MEGLGAGWGVPGPDPIPPSAQAPQTTPGFWTRLEQPPSKGKHGGSPSPHQPPHTTASFTPSCKSTVPGCTAKPCQALCEERLIGKAPFPHRLGFSFHTANWSIIHLLWHSPAPGMELCWAGASGSPSPSRTRREGINVFYCSRMHRGFGRALIVQTTQGIHMEEALSLGRAARWQ